MGQYLRYGPREATTEIAERPRRSVAPDAFGKKQHHNEQEYDPQRICPDIGIGKEGYSTIGIDDGGCVLEDDGANGWAYHAGYEDLSNDAGALELAGAAFWD